MKSSRTSIVVILMFGFLLNTFTPVIKSIVSTIEYAALSEKEISHEILVESTSFLEKLSAKDLIKFKDFTQKDLLPLIEKFELLDSILVREINDDVFENSLFLNESVSIIKEINDINLTTENKNFKDILGAILFYFNEIQQLLEKSKSSEDLLLPKSKLRNLINGIFSLILNILDKGSSDNKSVAIQEYMIQNLGKKSKNLIDDKPYFSMPPEYSQEKEKEIFEFIKLNPHSPLGLIALTQLYIEMRNMSDAQLIFRNFIAPQKIADEDIRIGKLLTKEQINDFNSKNINANLIEANVSIKENGNAIIEEEYEIFGTTEGKEVIILLPFRKETFSILNFQNQSEDKIEQYELRNSWKSSTVVTIKEGKALKKIKLKYETSEFLKYDDEFGKYVFRYGGVSTSKRLICNVSVPNTFAITNLEQSYIQAKSEDEQYVLKWVNPTLEYKISPIKYVGIKSGVAGELVSVWLMHKRYTFTLFVFVAFLVLTNITNKRLKSIWASLSYLMLAFLVVIYLMNDIQIVEAHGTIFDNIPTALYRILFGILLMGFIVMSEIRYFSGNNYVVTSMCIFEFALAALFLKLYFDNTDFNNTILTVIAMIGLLSYLNSLASELANRLNYYKSTLFTFMVITFCIFYFVYRNIELFKFSKSTLSIIGYVFGGLILILLGILFIASERKILNKSKKGLFARIFEWLSITLEPIASDSSKILLILLVIITFFFNSAILTIFIGLAFALASDLLKKIINYDSIIGKEEK